MRPLEYNKPNSRYSEAEIMQFNAAHDRKYGWTSSEPHLYTNLTRLPEFAPADPDPFLSTKITVDTPVPPA